MQRSLTLWPLVSLLLAGCHHREPTACTPARANWSRPSAGQFYPIHNKVTLKADGSVLWNGYRVTEASLDHLLGLAKKIPTIPAIDLQAEMGVSCRQLDRLRDYIEVKYECNKSNGNSLCFEGLPGPNPDPNPLQ
jgi:hypothetical protein